MGVKSGVGGILSIVGATAGFMIVEVIVNGTWSCIRPCGTGSFTPIVGSIHNGGTISGWIDGSATVGGGFVG